ncbi:MAG TPA: kelch repeat-containing protein [Vicinamibacteria bacterium]|nr:kelch repeat-containing protein [Vicinamibacteria bacterium]
MRVRHFVGRPILWLAVFLILLGSDTVLGQGWAQLFPTGTPPTPRSGAMYAYDEINDRLILFSGEFGVHPHPADVWVLENASGTSGVPNWVQLRTTVGPVGRLMGTLVYDSWNDRAILHGGCGDLSGFAHCSPGFKDAWYLTNANGMVGSPQWFTLPSSNVHSTLGRELHTAVYDPNSNRMIVFGGTLPFNNNDRNDVELLINPNGMGSPSWMFLSPSGPLPLPRQGGTAVYDANANRMVVFGGHRGGTCSPATTTFNDVWVLSDANGTGSSPQWRQLSPLGTPPSARSGHSAVYDPSSNRMTVFGGVSFDSCANFLAFFNDVWVLTHANGLGGTPEWSELTPSGALPLGRFRFAAGYSPSRNRMVITTGHNRFVSPPNGTDFNDVWVLNLNVAPTVTADSPEVAVPEGAVAYNMGSFSDPGEDLSLTASIGIVEPAGGTTGTWTWSFPTEDGPVESQIVTITATDSQGASSSVDFDLIVHNVPPALTLSLSAAAIDENGIVMLSASVHDPGILDTQTVVINWGEGSPTTLTLGGGEGSFSASHQYLDDDPTATPSDAYNIAVTVSDKDGGGDYEEAGILVYNAPPVITSLSGPTGPLALGNPAGVTATFTDVGTQDTHTCTFSWDDGSPATTVSGTASCTATHSYTAPGVYTVGVAVSDDDTGRASANFEYVVIYDPNGGFVTGGGFINSPLGAYVPEPSLTGKANFGFVSKYKPGTTVPTGSTEFQFHAASLNFHSSKYDWLVVAGAKAQYKGSGTISGSGDYGFLLTARDGQAVGGGGVDKFRIKIWDKSGGTVVYDNAPGPDDVDSSYTQALGGGSIVIHK